MFFIAVFRSLVNLGPCLLLRCSSRCFFTRCHLCFKHRVLLPFTFYVFCGTCFNERKLNPHSWDGHIQEVCRASQCSCDRCKRLCNNLTQVPLLCSREVFVPRLPAACPQHSGLRCAPCEARQEIRQTGRTEKPEFCGLCWRWGRAGQVGVTAGSRVTSSGGSEKSRTAFQFRTRRTERCDSKNTTWMKQGAGRRLGLQTQSSASFIENI